MLNKVPLFFTFFLLFVACSSDEEELNYTEISDNYIIHCPEPPIEIMSSTDEESVARGEKLLNYFNIIQISENYYYMYYETFTGMGASYEGVIRFAYSNDGINWTKNFPNNDKTGNIIFSKGVAGISVVQIPDNDYPFRMFGSGKFDSGAGIYMWKSKDGMSFSNRHFVIEGLFDTQQVAVYREGMIKLYTRLWEDKDHNRKIGVMYIDRNGNVIKGPYPLRDNFVYNSAASCLDVNYDLLFPTFFRDTGENVDNAYIKAMIVSGYNSKEIKCNIGEWIGNKEPWMLVSPGIIDINGKKYISYYTRSWSHMSEMPNDGISLYKLIEIQIEKK